MSINTQKILYSIIAFFSYLFLYGAVLLIYCISDFTTAFIFALFFFLLLFIPFCILFGYKGYHDFKSIWTPVLLNSISTFSFIIVLTLTTCIKDSGFLYTQLDFVLDFVLIFSAFTITMYSAKFSKYKLFLNNKRKEK